jgi:hypothetical protein
MRSQDENSSQERKQQMKLNFSPKLHKDGPTSKTTLSWKKSLRGYQLHYFCKGRLWDSVIYILLQLQKAPHTQLQLHLEYTSQEVYNYFKQVLLMMKKWANHVASCYKQLVSACAQSTTAGLASNMIKINEVAHLKNMHTNWHFFKVFLVLHHAWRQKKQSFANVASST